MHYWSSLLVAMMALVAGCERKIVNEIANNDQSLNGCFACHGETSFDGALLQAKGEWENSFHASGISIDYTNRPGSDCQQCHNHQGFLDWILPLVKRTRCSVDSQFDSLLHLPCSARKRRLSLRVTEPYTLKNGVVFDHGAANLCVNCHHSRTNIANDIAGGDTLRYHSQFAHGSASRTAGRQSAGNACLPYSGQRLIRARHMPPSFAMPVSAVIWAIRHQHDGYNVGGHSFNMEFEAHDGTTYTLVGVCATCHARLHSVSPTLMIGRVEDIDGDGTIEGIQTEFDNLG